MDQAKTQRLMDWFKRIEHRADRQCVRSLMRDRVDQARRYARLSDWATDRWFDCFRRLCAPGRQECAAA